MLDDQTAQACLSRLKEGGEVENRSILLYEVGDYYRELGFLELALELLRKSNELQPQRWRTLLALGRSYFDQGNFREAQPSFQETQRLVHDHPEPGLPSPEFASASAYEYIADILCRQRPTGFASMATFYEQAALLYERAGDRASASRCRLRLSLVKLEEAEMASQDQPVLELGYRIFPNNAQVAWRLGNLYLSQSLHRLALRCFLRAGRLDSPWRMAARQAAIGALERLAILPEQQELLSRPSFA